MLQKIIHTLGSRLIIAILNLLLLFLTTRILGAEIKGLISVFILNISIGTIISGFIGGPAIVYLVPRQSIIKIIVINLLWSVIAVIGLTALLFHFEFLVDISLEQFIRIGIFECILTALLMVFLGLEKIKTHNIVSILKILFINSILLVSILFGEKTFDAFLIAYEVSLLISIVISVIKVIQVKHGSKISSTWSETIKAGIKYGGTVQLGNLAQLLNYRAGFYAIELIISPLDVAIIRIGIYSASLQIAESLWQFTRSVNTVQYASISNISNRLKAVEISLKLVRLNYAVTTIGVIFLALIPTSFYTSIFGTDFSEIKQHFLYLSPGILALAFGGGINHYFAGIGKHRFNTFSSMIGLLVTLILVYPLVRQFGTYGAAITSTIVYIVQASIQVVIFWKTENVGLQAFLLSKNDVYELREKLRIIWNRI